MSMKEFDKQSIVFVLITLGVALVFYWIVKGLLLPYLPDWVSSLVLYERKYTVRHRHTNILMGISGCVGGIVAVFLLSYSKKGEKK